MNNMPKLYGTIVREHRHEAHITLANAAKHTGISPARLSEIETSGGYPPTTDEAHAIKQMLRQHGEIQEQEEPQLDEAYGYIQLYHQHKRQYVVAHVQVLEHPESKHPSSFNLRVMCTDATGSIEANKLADELAKDGNITAVLLNSRHVASQILQRIASEWHTLEDKACTL